MFPSAKGAETIWLHSFSAGRIYDNACLLASFLLLRRDKPKALAPVLAVIAGAPGRCRPEGHRFYVNRTCILTAIPLLG